MYAFAHFGKELRQRISDAVGLEFGHRVDFQETYLDLSMYFDARRRQYNGDQLLRVVGELAGPGPFKVVGLFNVDLFIPILTYIFGQAQFGGQTAIASIYRLANERYGIRSTAADVQDRFIKEVIHELGHTFGLPHCHVPNCVMRSSTYVEDIDQKDMGLCPSCRSLAGLAG